MTKWRVWLEVEDGAHEYLGEAEGRSFEAACAAYAKAQPTPDWFDPLAMTYRGCRLVALDRRRDGAAHVFTGFRQKSATR